MLQIWNNRYFSHDGNIKCVDLTIKYIEFESFYYAINRAGVSSYMVFNDFIYMFL